MPSLGPAEILVILVVALLVFGPNKLPEIARHLVRGLRELRRVQQFVSSELRDAVTDLEVGDPASPAPSGRPGGDPVPTLPPVERAASSEPPADDGRGTTGGTSEEACPPSAGTS